MPKRSLMQFYRDWEKGKPFVCVVCGARAESLFQTAAGPAPVCSTACGQVVKRDNIQGGWEQ